jgi:hypothetical protein
MRDDDFDDIKGDRGPDETAFIGVLLFALSALGLIFCFKSWF